MKKILKCLLEINERLKLKEDEDEQGPALIIPHN